MTNKTLRCPLYDSDIDMMYRTGGSFAQAIATAYTRADSINKAKLRAGLPELFGRYEHLYAAYMVAYNERRA